MASKGSTTAVTKPTVKMPNAKQAAAPIIKTKVAKLNLKNNSSKSPKNGSSKSGSYVPPSPIQ